MTAQSLPTAEALQVLVDLASRWLENAEEGLPARISPEMLTNDALWATVLAGLGDEYEVDMANDCRAGLKALQTVNAMLAQKGCEHFDPAVADGKLTTLCDVVVFG